MFEGEQYRHRVGVHTVKIMLEWLRISLKIEIALFLNEACIAYIGIISGSRGIYYFYYAFWSFVLGIRGLYE